MFHLWACAGVLLRAGGQLGDGEEKSHPLGNGWDSLSGLAWQAYWHKQFYVVVSGKVQRTVTVFYSQVAFQHLHRS